MHNCERARASIRRQHQPRTHNATVVVPFSNLLSMVAGSVAVAQAFRIFKSIAARTTGMSAAARIDLITSVAAKWNLDCEARRVLLLVTMILSVPTLYEHAQLCLLAACKRLQLIGDDVTELPSDVAYVNNICQPNITWVQHSVAQDFTTPLPDSLDEKDQHKLAALVHRIEMTALLMESDNAKGNIGNPQHGHMHQS